MRSDLIDVVNADVPPEYLTDTGSEPAPGPSDVDVVATEEQMQFREMISQLKPRLVTPAGVVIASVPPDVVDALTDDELAAELDAVEPATPNPALTPRITDAIFGPVTETPASRPSWVSEPFARRPRSAAGGAPAVYDTIRVFDTTMRNGQRTHCAPMGLADRLALARALADMNVDVIELGCAASEADCRAVQKIAPQIERATLCVMARCTHDLSDVHKAVRVLADVPRTRARVHVALVGEHFKVMLKTREGRATLYDSIEQNIALVRRAGMEVEFSVEDGSRDRFLFLRSAFEAAIAAGATLVNLADSSGAATPVDIARRIERLRRRLPVQDGVIFSVHCHNDMGLAVANSLAGCYAGARQVHCTVNGIGRRAGNAALEEVVMNIDERRDRYRLRTGIEHRHLGAVSRMVSTMAGLPLPRNKPIVGVEAVIPAPPGVPAEAADAAPGAGASDKVTISKWLTIQELGERLRRSGFQPNDDQLERVYRAYKELGRTKAKFSESDLFALMFDHLKPHAPRGFWSLANFHCSTGNEMTPQAHVRLRDPEGQLVDAAAPGKGSIDAVCNAIARATSIPVNVTRLETAIVSRGVAAPIQITLDLSMEERIYTGRAVSVDIMQAVVSACLNAVNEIYLERLGGFNGDPEFDATDDPYSEPEEFGVIPFQRTSFNPCRRREG
jgi:2-isopropylmalate synthase